MKNNKNYTVILKRVLKFIAPYRFYLCIMLLFAVISSAFTLYTPILIGKGIDLIAGKGRVSFEGIPEILITLASVSAITALSQWFMSLANNHIACNAVRDMRSAAFRHLENVPVNVIDATQTGEAMSRIITDIEQFSDGLLIGFTQLFTGVITIAGTLGFMLFINVKIAAVVAVITPLSLFAAAFIAKRTFSMFKLQSETRGEMTSLVEELVGNQKVVKAFSYESRAEQRFEAINERLRVCGIRALFFSAITNPVTRFVNGLVYAGAGIFGALTAISGGITIGQLTSFLSYANQYTKPFNEISQVITELQNAVACAGRVFDFIDTPLTAPDKENAVAITNPDGNISLKNVHFSYTDAPFLKDISFEAGSGQRIAIVGSTGSGKTTVINLLMRFYEIKSGRIEIDSRSVQEIKLNSLRENFGMVLQETWLRSGTISENIAYGKPDASRDEIIEAAKAAHAHSFIKRMSGGYDTVISENGGNLSAGQKQLLCIARVMLIQPPMLILDEATSSIDTRTEIIVQQAFQNLMRGRTSIVIAHRLSTIREADIILVINEGTIGERGTHDELLNKNGLYKEIYESQFNG